MEEEKKQGVVTDIEKVREKIISSTKSEIKILNSARDGTQDYDFGS